MTKYRIFVTWPSWFADVNALLASAVCHLVALIAMAWAVVAGDAPPPGLQLTIDVAETPDASARDNPLWLDALTMNATSDAAIAAGPVRLFHDTAPSVGDFGPLKALFDVADRVSGLDGQGLVDLGDSSGAKKQPGQVATEFFGISGYGKTFVYVVDCSGSMREEGKFERAVYELLRSIEQLTSDQQYFIIFYNHAAFPMATHGPVPATLEQFETTRHWISYAQPQGGTAPLPALLAALKMKPDAIFFLSDGLFDPRTSGMVRASNRGKKSRIPIHTIAFVNREAEGLMRTIARNSGGEYRFVK
jgi:hypothetical protein